MRELTCIGCPIGCALTVQIREGDKVAYGYSATGTDPVTNLRHSIAFFGGS